jgi:hypothetical protein
MLEDHVARVRDVLEPWFLGVSAGFERPAVRLLVLALSPFASQPTAYTFTVEGNLNDHVSGYGACPCNSLPLGFAGLLEELNKEVGDYATVDSQPVYRNAGASVSYGVWNTIRSHLRLLPHCHAKGLQCGGIDSSSDPFPTPDTYEVACLRGHGSFGRSVKALSQLVQAGVTTFVSFTASRRNFREFEQVAQLCRKLGVNRLWADRHVPVGNGSDLHTLNCKETLELFSAMYKAGRCRFAARPGKTEISMRRGLQFLISGGNPYRCSAGAGLIKVLPDGEFLPCRRMPLRVGNVMETPLVELYAYSATLNALRDTQRVSKGYKHVFLLESAVEDRAACLTRQPVIRL